jgi:hypothetical protein
VPSEGTDPGKGRWTRTLTTVGVVIGVVAGAIGLLFTLVPDLKPCLGENSVVFTGAPVFPRVGFRDHLIRSGIRKEKVAKEPNLLGAEVRFSYRTSGFRGDELAVTWSLIRIERDGTLGAVVRGQDRALATTVTPETCSEVGGKDLFLQIPNPGVRYRVVLELYRTPALRDRLTLTETAPFRG